MYEYAMHSLTVCAITSLHSLVSCVNRRHSLIRPPHTSLTAMLTSNALCMCVSGYMFVWLTTRE